LFPELFYDHLHEHKAERHAPPDIACGRHADDFNSSVLVWRILFWSVTGGGMLLELFVSTTMNTKLKDARRLRPAQPERHASPAAGSPTIGATIGRG
jgi:hypothetical protein